MKIQLLFIIAFLFILCSENLSRAVESPESVRPIFHVLFGQEKGDEFLRSTLKIVKEEEDESAILARLSKTLGQEKLILLLATLDQFLDKENRFNRLIKGGSGVGEDYRLHKVIEFLRAIKSESISSPDQKYLDELKARIEKEGQPPSWARLLLGLVVFLLLIILASVVFIKIGLAAGRPDNKFTFSFYKLLALLIMGFNIAANRLTLSAVKRAVSLVARRIKAVISLITGKVTTFISTVKETIPAARNYVKENTIKVLLVALGCWVLIATLIGFFSYLGHGQTNWKKAETAYVKGDYNYARKKYLKAAAKRDDLLRPQLIDLYRKLGGIALQQGDWDNAFKFYTQAISVSGITPANVFSLCQAYESRAKRFIQEFNYPKAVIFYKKALEKLKELDQTNQEVIEWRLRFHLGLASAYEGIEVKKAEKEYKDILAALEPLASELPNTTPSSSGGQELSCLPLPESKQRGYVYFRLGNLYLEEEKWEEALTNYEQALDLGYRRLPLYHKLAVAYKALGDLKEAEFYFQDILFRGGMAQKPMKIESVLKWYDLGIKQVRESGLNETDLKPALDELSQAKSTFLASE